MADSVQQITALVHHYCELFDTGQFDEFAAQFERGQWHRADPGAVAARRWIDDNVHVYDGLPRTKHLTTNLTVQVDEQGAEVDVLSGGRLVLAVGTGWNPVEYESLGVPFGGRGRRLDEQVELLRRLWREPVLDYRGEFHRVDRAGILPRPVRGSIPLWFGGSAEVSLVRAARTGDGFVFGSAGPRTHRRAARLRDLLAADGRDPATFGLDAMIDYALGPQGWADEAPAWEAQGGTILSIQTMQSGTGYQRVSHHKLADPAAHIAALGEFARVLRGG
jgi:alkanesulfonate monooxygenase SsuD/methylene tetrahydromethanopterin reductase-like flavin-dependent oxidoreductase (luciferase family)